MQNQYAPPRANVADVNRSSGGITNEMLNAMRGTKSWTMLVGVVLIIFAAFMILGTLGALIGSIGMAAMGGKAAMAGAPMLVIVIIYGIGAVIYLLLGIYLIKYSRAIGRLLLSNSAGDMEDALWSQQKFWKLSGILTLIAIVIMVLAIVAAITMPMLLLGGMH